MVLLNAQNAHCSAVAWERTVQAVGDSVILQTFLAGTLLPVPAGVTQKKRGAIRRFRRRATYTGIDGCCFSPCLHRPRMGAMSINLSIDAAVFMDESGHGREVAVEQQDNLRINRSA
jgi:hypothetical protein